MGYDNGFTRTNSPPLTFRSSPKAAVPFSMVGIMDRKSLLLTLGFVLLGFWAADLFAADEARREFFESRIRPVLVKHCYECHSAESKEIKGKLRLDSATGLLRGGDSGASLVAGKPNESLLMEALRYESFEMPPAGRLPKKVVADFEKWIKTGAYDPRTEEPAAAPTKAPRKIDLEEGRRFWAFQPVKRATPPVVSDQQWPLTPIDRFVLAKLEQAKLQPAPAADRRTLIRRLYFDLIGLPPRRRKSKPF